MSKLVTALASDRRIPVGVLLLLVAALPIEGAQTAEGQAIFERACAGCHGPGGGGGRGPSLRRQLRHGAQAADIQTVIENGLPGTGMPEFHFDPDELDVLVPYVQSLSRAGGSEAIPEQGGDPSEGRRIYDSSGCAGCHKIGAHGSAFGPNLTRVGTARSYPYLKASILDPSSDVPEEYQAVTVVTAAGRSVTGVRVNEDSFTIQLRLADQSFTSFDKQKIQKETAASSSLMPAYRLDDQHLKDLLAYLVTLSGDSDATKPVKEDRR